jgi:hypothetical protein
VPSLIVPEIVRAGHFGKIDEQDAARAQIDLDECTGLIIGLEEYSRKGSPRVKRVHSSPTAFDGFGLDIWLSGPKKGGGLNEICG